MANGRMLVAGFLHRVSFNEKSMVLALTQKSVRAINEIASKFALQLDRVQ